LKPWSTSSVVVETMRAFPSYALHLRILPVVTPLQEFTTNAARAMLRMLFLAVAVMFLLTCANLAGLLLVRSIRRQREIVVRRVPALLRAIVESLVLSVNRPTTNPQLRLGVCCVFFEQLEVAWFREFVVSIRQVAAAGRQTTVYFQKSAIALFCCKSTGNWSCRPG
jgi:hypothetical protein